MCIENSKSPVNSNNSTNDSNEKIVSTYNEVKIGKTLYRVTSVYLGKIDLQKTLEDYTVRKVLATINDPNTEW